MIRIAVSGREACIRRYRPEDEPQVLRLYQASFEPDALDKLVERGWRHERNPEGPHRTMVCALEDGSLIASYTGIPLRASLCGRAGRAAVMVDAMTHPAYRGAVLGRGGVFARTALAWVSEFTVGADPVRFTFGVPQRRHARLGRLLMGYEIVDDIGYYSREITDTTIKRIRRRLPDPRVRVVEGFGVEADRLWGRLASSYPSAVVRDGRYLRWRYDECPRHDYLRLVLRGRGGAWDGWLVLSVEDETATVVDALFPPALPAGASALLYRALGAALERGATFMRAWASAGTPIERLLVAGGFWKGAYEGLRFACRLFDDSIDGDALRKSWYFQPGDTDDH